MNQEPAELSKKSETVKTLGLREMIFLGKGTFTRQLIHALISIALRLFFRRIEAVNVEKSPAKWRGNFCS